MTRKPNIPLDAKHYDPALVEDAINCLWDKESAWVADASSKKEPYTIVIPPPNVTGRLHMGHALNNTIQDLLIRYKRMDGFNALWVPGTDHAGISTQSVVKKHLDAEGVNYRELGRDKMIERIWEWKGKYGDHILHQLKKLGCSCDWSRTRFTMDEGLSRAVAHAFKKMYEDGLVYRGKYIVNWCPVDRTALSDDEVETKDGGEPGKLWYFKYSLVGKEGHIEIATTRPETMLGDVAVAVNPKDDRFKELVGSKVMLPIVEREIPIIADDYVDPEFGTGCVKITPAHDPNDFQLGLRHDLPQINVMNEDATMGDEAPERFHGINRYKARKMIVTELDELGLLSKIEERNVPVGRSYRSKEVIEYRLSDQWFVKMKPLAERALKASEAGEIRYVPERWDSFYRGWLEKTRDWCISRQIWWGHRIPAWYHKETGEILVDVETPKQVTDSPDQWRQDEDVLDTWFSSALWPYSTLGWPEKTADLQTFYPNSILVTGKDIIFFWVARMVMTGLYHEDKAPFHTVLINSIICDEDGETMSKSRGNGIDPLHVISGASREELEGPVREARAAQMEKQLERIAKRFPDGFAGVGSDALRYTMLTTATDAQQVQISLKRFDEIGRPFTDKIWNASKLILSFFDDCTEVSSADPQLEDLWILTHIDTTIDRVRNAFDTYALHHATDALYHFFWDDLCDWYLETVKFRMKEGSAEEKRRVCETVSEVMLTFLKALHPVMPFITEELWGHFQSRSFELSLHPDLTSDELCATASFPKSLKRTEGAQYEFVQDAVRTIRNMRAAANVSPKVALDCVIVPAMANAQAALKESSDIVRRLANLASITFCEVPPTGMSSATLSSMKVFLNLAEHRDVEADKKRYQKSIEKLDAQIGSLEKKLSNKNFVDKAPTEVVAKEQEKLHSLKEQKEGVTKALQELAG